MTRSEFKRECAYAGSLVDPVVELLRARLPVLVSQAIEREFSANPPLALHEIPAPPFEFEARAVLETARGILSAARQKTALYVARAVAERLSAGDGAKWLAVMREREARARTEFEDYAQEQRKRVELCQRIAQMRHRSTAPKRSASANAIRARITAVRLPSIR